MEEEEEKEQGEETLGVVRKVREEKKSNASSA